MGTYAILFVKGKSKGNQEDVSYTILGKVEDRSKVRKSHEGKDHVGFIHYSRANISGSVWHRRGSIRI